MDFSLRHYAFLFIATLVFGCASSITEKDNTSEHLAGLSNDAYSLVIHDRVHVDEYRWLRGERPLGDVSEDVLKLIDTENKQTNDYFADKSELIDVLYEEMAGRSYADFHTTPIHTEHFVMYPKYDSENDRYLTRHVTLKRTDESFVLLDENERAKGSDYFSLRAFSASNDASYFAWIEDTKGDNVGTLYVKELKPNSAVRELAQNVNSSLVWAPNGKSIFTVKKDAIGRDADVVEIDLMTGEMTTIHRALDPEFSASIKGSTSEQYLFIRESNGAISASFAMAFSDANRNITSIVGAEANIEQHIDHIGDRFYVYHNGTASNFSISSFITIGDTKAHWQTVYTSEQGVLKVPVFLNDYIVFIEHIHGSDFVKKISISDNSVQAIKFGDERHYALLQRANATENKINIYHQSLLSPLTLFEVDLKTDNHTVLGQSKAPGFNEHNYVTKRLLVKSLDGTEVPVTYMAHKKALARSNTLPLLLYVYGAYGNGISPEFQRHYLSLIDRGFAFAVAHIRGGNELGSDWHHQATKLNRKNAFVDFSAVINYLVDNEYASRGMITLAGESAAGQPVGVAINQMPGMFKAVTLEVPFVDVLNTLLDDTLEYTPPDWSEFGNPLSNIETFNYIKSYCPFQNVSEHEYPDMYVTAGLNDIAVGYWEPMKWVYKIRENQTNDSTTLLEIRGGGHMPSGKNSLEHEMSRTLAFIISQYEGTIK